MASFAIARRMALHRFAFGAAGAIAFPAIVGARDGGASAAGRPIVWDLAKMSALDVPEADALLKPEIAPEWLIPV